MGSRQGSAIFLAVVIVAVGFVSYILGVQHGSSGGPRGGTSGGGSCTPNLTIRRTDTIPDFTQHITPPVSSTKIMDFAITNHSTSTTYGINIFYLFPGLQNGYLPERISNLRIFNNGNQIAFIPSLPYRVAQVPTSSLVIAPHSTLSFTMRADIIHSPPGTPSSTLQVSLGEVFAVPAGSNNPFAHERVFKESNGIELQSPLNGPPDESLESAVFLAP